MKPQDLYTIPSIRLLFDRIVHSSIMRLNEQSMDKLYDLILMGLKYQAGSPPRGCARSRGGLGETRRFPCRYCPASAWTS